MKRIVLFSIISTLVFSLAAPTGAAFALEEELVSSTGGGEVQVEVLPEASATKGIVPEIDVTKEPEPLAQPASLLQEPTALIGEPVMDLPVVPVEIPQPPEEAPLPPQRKVYMTALQKTNALGFVELYNSDTKTQSINTWRFVAEFIDGQAICEVPLAGYILPKTKVLLAEETMPNIQNALTYACGEPSRVAKSVLLYDGDQVVERLVFPATDNQIWVRKNTTSTYLTGIFLQDFKADDQQAGKQYVVTDGYWYVPPLPPTIQVLEVYVSPRQCVVPDESIDCYDYVKIKNTAENDPIDLGNYRLRSGYNNAAASSSNTTYSSVVLAPGEVRTLTHDQYGAPISFTANDGTVWFEDIEGMVSYPTTVPPYIGSDLAANKGRSWAYNSATNEWQWATPAPETEENNFAPTEAGKGMTQAPELVPCKDNQYRSEETNRCRNITAPSTLTPCREGQYRSEETNRCRSIATAAAAVLKPCADDEFRNPATNRCKKIASSDEVALADCGEGRERNPLTNRCRNVLGASTLTETMPFPVEKIEQGTERFSGWWTLGIVVAAGLGYGVWEWREELLRAGRRAGRFVSRSK